MPQTPTSWPTQGVELLFSSGRVVDFPIQKAVNGFAIKATNRRVLTFFRLSSTTKDAFWIETYWEMPIGSKVTCQEFCAACSTNEPVQLDTLVKIFDKEKMLLPFGGGSKREVPFGGWLPSYCYCSFLKGFFCMFSGVW